MSASWRTQIIDYCERAGTDVEIEGCLSSRSECCRGDVRAPGAAGGGIKASGRLKRKKLRGFEARVFQPDARRAAPTDALRAKRANHSSTCSSSSMSPAACWSPRGALGIGRQVSLTGRDAPPARPLGLRRRLRKGDAHRHGTECGF